MRLNGLVVLMLLTGGAASAVALADGDPRAQESRPTAASGVRDARTDARQEYPFIPAEGRFVMARIQYEEQGRLSRWGWGSCGGREPPWHHDYPYAEQNFTQILRELTLVRPYTDGGNVFELGDPRLHQFPIAYLSEPGCWSPTDEEVAALRAYLERGGFIIFDDFGGRQGPRDLSNLMEQLRRVLPDHQLVPLEPNAAIFDSFFLIDPAALNMPDYRGRINFWGIYEDNDPNKRLMVIAGNEGDLGEFWEYRATGFYSIDLANEAYKVGVNYIVYAMTH